MKASKHLAAAFALLLAAGFLLASGVQEKASPASEGKIQKSFVRKELLSLRQGEMSSPKRNIFSPQTFSSPPAIPEDQAANLPQEEEFEGGSDQREDEGPPLITISLRYIGYVQSRGHIIGLIILDGEALAVREGEVVSEGFRIGKITALEIEVIGPDGETRRFPLEGDEG